ncbi:hypothetical protein DYB28_001749 [Aphanomyces astaci]|uniref:DHHA2 domain-containing protein n=1 Tax=Aphanomyces astaci TaxID=112090 RepID=A0A397A8S1_APHAT|nr:hypothetical protein DYB25_001199 [Aphanomyces astaci]RHY55507.1 hypothetical protein DYB34_005506 [Aphanomyces astaci]RLO02321.1 hypothetical protein DYB28_001749 [Aphanomyces astaci]
MSRPSALAAVFQPVHAEKLNAFLRTSRSAALSNTFKQLHVVIGNEACDADSMVSSLVHAFFRGQARGISNTPSSTVVLPVMSVDRDQFRLRCETKALFDAAHIDVDALVFQNEIDLPAIHAARQLTLTLTDHNKLKRGYASLSSAVTDIIDHHEDLGSHNHVTGARRRIAFEKTDHGGNVLAGSCCTLIAEEIVAQSSSSLPPLDATLLLAVILLDNLNMDPKMKKGTPRDFAMVDALLSHALVPRLPLYEWLVFEKFNPANWTAFSFANCLQYDYKQFESHGVSYGCSSILVDLATFWAIGGGDVVVQLEQHRQALDLAFVVVQSMIQSGPRRQLLVYAKDPTLQLALKTHLDNVAVLDLAPLDVHPAVIAYDQHNVALSRKQLVPLLDTFLKQLASQL